MKRIRISFLVLFSILLTTVVFAAERKSSSAYEIAYRKLFEASTSPLQKSPGYVQPQLLLSAPLDGAHANKTAYYIYSNANGRGFVIVSGDDRAEEVLAYSLDESIDVNNLPDGFEYWLDNYKEEIQWMVENPSALNTTLDEKQKVQTIDYATVSPLTAHIKWNQSAPYNNLCPLIPGTTTRTVAGCVATGMGIVMRYHTWPLQGNGSNSYTTSTHKISINETFTGTTYDWANMTDTYTSTSTAEQNDAVAKLIYHAGVAVNMNYDNSSGALVTSMANALKNNFGYDTKLNLLYRDFYSRADWMRIIKEELLLQRPVLYAGSSQAGGHLFVCDGFDNDDYFHMNWGWGGMSNGFFKISALAPSSHGIGGGIGGFNKQQNIVVGLQKPNTSSTHTTAMCMNLPLTASKIDFPRTETFGVTMSKIYNYSINPFSGSLGVALYQNGAFVSILSSNTVTELRPNYGWSTLLFNNLLLSNTLAAGNYEIFPVYRLINTQPWLKVGSKVGTPNSLNLELRDNRVYITLPSDVGPQLVLDDLTLTGSIYQNRLARFSVTINNKRSEYNSILGVYLQSKDNSTITQFIRDDINLVAGETETYYFNSKVTLAPGEYYLAAMYDAKNNRSEVTTVTQLGANQLVTIKANPTGLPNFNLMSAISFDDNNNVDPNKLELKADITNNGDFFDERMLAFIFPRAGGSSLTYIGLQTAIFDPAERRNVTFRGSVSLAPGEYLIGAYFYHPVEKAWKRLTDDAQSLIPFTFIDTHTSYTLPEKIAEISVYPNPARDFVNVQTDEQLKYVRIYHIDGKLVAEQPISDRNLRIDIAQLKAGNYIMVFEAGEKTMISRFVKL